MYHFIKRHVTGTGFIMVLFIMIMIIVPAWLTLTQVKDAGIFEWTLRNPTPYGYTVSLLFFIFPCIILSIWFWLHPTVDIQKKSFFMTVLVLIPLGFLLDIFLGDLFFSFPNKEATLQIFVPGFNFHTFSFEKILPVEEFGFYTFGFLAVLLLYIWCDEYWFKAYNIPNYHSETSKLKKLTVIHWNSLTYTIIMVILALIIKKFGTHGHNEGFPAYLIFLIIAGMTPGILLFQSVKTFINYRAFSFTFLLILFISLLWEVTLAMPYQWWAYNANYMVGIFIPAWHGLPIEEPILWMCVTWTTVIVYEAIKVYYAMPDQPMIQKLLGKKE